MDNPPTPSRPSIPPWAVLLLVALAAAAGLLVPWFTGNSAPDVQARLTRLYGAAAVVLGSAVAVLVAGRKWLAKSATQGKDLAVLGCTTVGSRVRIVMVRAKGQRLLAGLDAGGIKILLPLPEAPQG